MAGDRRTDGHGEAGVVYYSRTGNTRQVALDVESTVASARTERIRPRRQRSYWNWLLRSFVPGSTVAIEPMPTDFRTAEAVFLGSPKWTVSCPPVNEFLDRANLAGVPTGVFVTYGGFDEERYAESLVDRVESIGGDVRATLLVDREDIGSESYHDRVASFCRSVLE